MVVRCDFRAGGEHVGSEGPCDLDRDVADPACTAMDQHLLASLQGGAVDQAFPGSDDDQGQGSRLAHAEIEGLERNEISIDRGEFGQRSLDTADSPGHAIDLVTRLEARDLAPGLFDEAGEVDAENSGHRLARMRRHAGMNLGVERIDRARAHPHQDLARADLGRGKAREP